jgi:hypothetical protein
LGCPGKESDRRRAGTGYLYRHFVEEDISYYFFRPVETNDTHGLGAFLMAGAEMIRAKDKLVDLNKRR